MRAATPAARLAAATALIVLFAAIGIAVATGLSSGAEEGQTATPSRPAADGAATGKGGRPASRHSRTTTTRVPVRGVAAYDPEGDGHENDELATQATDRNGATGWRTERYRSFFKHGVGLVLDAGRVVRATAIVVVTDKPGFEAQIQAGAGPQGPFRPVSANRRLSVTSTRFALSRASARYFVVWVTAIPPDAAADVNEVRLLASSRRS
jgi:hypothetical protein